jgi:hypothetical protein
VCRPHAGLHRAERMLDGLSTLAHGLWVCIKALPHSLEQMLMLPSATAPAAVSRVRSSTAREGAESSAGAAHTPGNLPDKSACRQPPRSYKYLDELTPICRDGLGSRSARLSPGREARKPGKGSAGDDIAGRLP